MREYARYEPPDWQEHKFTGRSSGRPIVWLLVGISIGAGAALLLTPSSGRELRQAIARQYRRTIDGVSRGTQDLRRHGSNLLSFRRNRSAQRKSQRG
jgi:gas vesicle protein